MSSWLTTPIRAIRWLRCGYAVLRRPSLWLTAWRMMWTFAPNQWWTHPPYLPVPPKEYVKFRMVTMYGGDGTTIPAPDEFLTYMRWWKRFPGPVG